MRKERVTRPIITNFPFFLSFMLGVGVMFSSHSWAGPGLTMHFYDLSNIYIGTLLISITLYSHMKLFFV